jgi:methylenetetrahydrofolate reductase (NADPH)
MELNHHLLMTTSREEFIYDKGNGLLDKKLTRMSRDIRICASIKHKYDRDTVPHVLCGGFTKKKPNIYWWIVII